MSTETSFGTESYVSLREFSSVDKLHAEKLIEYNIREMEYRLGAKVWKLLKEHPRRYFVLSYTGVNREQDLSRLALALRAGVFVNEVPGPRPIFREPLPPLSREDMQVAPPTLRQRLRNWWNRDTGRSGDNILQRYEVHRMTPCCIKPSGTIPHESRTN